MTAFLFCLVMLAFRQPARKEADSLAVAALCVGGGKLLGDGR